MVNSFGGKPAVEFEGRPMFAELAIALMAIRGGWAARWVEVYYLDKKQPYYMLDWNDTRPFSQKSVLPDSSRLQLMASIDAKCASDALAERRRRNPYSGAWDVLAWNADRILFIESKHAGKDRILGNQVRWYSGAIKAGLRPENFLVVQWRFEDEPDKRSPKKQEF
jgi:hypothetical protein